MSQLEGQELGGCKLTRKLGAGGMGEVYLAEQRRLGNRLVAVKVVTPDELTFHEEVAEDMARRFQREAALLGQLSHPNILPVHDSGFEQNHLYLVMEYAPEGSLADAMRGNAKHRLTLPVDLPRAVDMIGQIAAALQYTHDHGIIHRDVKPGNVLIRVEPDGRWKMLLADFGVARNMDTSSNRTQVSGTFAFMAPEQFSGKFSPASDQYALGVLAFLLLTGRTPFEGDLARLTHAHMFEPPPSLHSINHAITPAVEAVVARSLAKEPGARYPSVADFADALRAAATDTTVPSDQIPTVKGEHVATVAIPAVAQSESRPRLGRLVAMVLIAVVLLGAVAAATYLVEKQQKSATAQNTPTSTLNAATNTATTTGAGSLPTCDATTPTPTVGTDLKCLLDPPSTVSAPVLNDPAPLCDGQAQWTLETNVSHTCAASSVTLTSVVTTANSLACLDDRAVSQADGYMSVNVSRGAGGVALGYREGLGASTGTSGNFIDGYYLLVTSSAGATGPLDSYELTLLDAQGHTHIVGQPSALPSALAKDFQLGVAFHGSQMKLYINGNVLATITDSTLASGWVGLCAYQGSSTFQAFQVYDLAG
ncbi:MAG: serine/threonine-protein kinase [Ktedonobacterales bacterium]